MFVGPSGIGKSSASVQQDILWALGRPAFGIQPARPLKIITVQAENDDGDLAEMARGVMHGLGLSDHERSNVHKNTLYITERFRIGDKFISLLGEILANRPVDLLRIDPLQSFLGGDVSMVDVVTSFVQAGLNPLLQQYNFGCIICHHTPKTHRRDTTAWKASDWQYAGAGSAVLTNWARAIMVVDPCEGDPGLFRFIAAKRGGRIGWTDKHGAAANIRHFKHARESGVIFWEGATDDEIQSGTQKGLSENDILALLPESESVSKTVFIYDLNQKHGVGIKKVTSLVKKMLDKKKIFQSSRPRSGTRPEMMLSRFSVGDNVPE